MRIGTVTEIKPLERRVGLVPAVVATLTAHGHEVFVQSGAGGGVGLSDADYAAAGGKIVPDAAAVFAQADTIVKVKEPQAQEIAHLTPRHTLFTYLHLAPDPEQTRGLMASGCTAIAYETILGRKGDLPLLTPMSQVAGRMAAQVGAAYLLAPAGGRGLLMGGVPGVPPAKVIILGAGVSGFNAAEIAVGMRADVTIMDILPERLAAMDAHFEGRARTVLSSRGALLELLPTADLIIGCVLITGAAAPKLIRREDLKLMRKGSVLVDVAIDQGGCFETSHPTTHDEPTYVVDGVVHYCVANMPGAAPLTSTYALGAATTPYVMALADKGMERAFAEDPGFAAGLNVAGGRVVHPAVAASQDLPPVAA
ncbi:MAG: alanine dehydrogenase [Phenylobacterium sp.]|uniref:alanine dehydrogenase n=1 Tax=Phenylobacterium sp. TaxID=1871053 RepID=UPI0027326C9C|nr:alanine dehydrogenase [Phenylobacterium sp.]MDP3748037.1 alanine dehydrogenase [Phenylobacterium sp.]